MSEIQKVGQNSHTVVYNQLIPDSIYGKRTHCIGNFNSGGNSLDDSSTMNESSSRRGELRVSKLGEN